MPYIVFSNFKNGLDVRRSELTTQPGALLQLQDAIVNEGAEIENRYAFTSASAAAASTFGLESVTTGLLTFGSIADPGGWTSPVSYQRLQHPAVAEGGASVAMTSVLCSCSFANQAWVVAKFADGGVFAYNNGTVVPAFRNGQVLTGLTGNDKIAQQLANVIAAVNGFHVTAIVSSAGSYYFDVSSNAGLNYTPQVAVLSSASGTIATSQRLLATQGVTEIEAAGYLSVWGGSTGTITSIKVNNVEVLGSTVTYTQDNPTTASLIVATINNFISSPQYSASIGTGGFNNFIYINGTSGSGATANGYVIKVTTTGDFIVDNTFITLPTGTGNACTSIKTLGVNLIPANTSYSAGGAYTANVTAGQTYTWTKGANDTNLVNGVSTYTVTTTFVASGSTVTLHGTVSINITAYLQLLTEILGATVNQTSSIAQWGSDIATQIRTNNVANAFANSSGVVFIGAKVRASDDAFPVGVQVTLTTGSVSGNTASGNPVSRGVYAFVSPNYGTITLLQNRTKGFYHGTSNPTFSAFPSGGIAPYTFEWTQSSTFNVGVTLKNTTSSTCSISLNGVDGATGTVYLQCLVTDSSPNSTQYLTLPISIFCST